MTLQELTSFDATRSFRVVEDHLVGIYKGYPFQLTLRSKNTRDTVTLCIQVEKAIPGKLLRAIKKRLPKGGMASSAIVGQLVAVASSENDRDTHLLVSDMLEIATSELRGAKKPLYPPEKCPICRKTGCDSAALMGGQYVPVHGECVKSHSETTVQKAEKNQQSGSYLLGLVGAFLGAVVGCVPTVLLIFLMQMEFGLLYILIPLASYQGYKLARGKLGGVARIIVIFCSLLAFALMLPALYFIPDKLAGVTNSFFYYVTWYYNRDSGYILLESWFGLIFLILGIISGFKSIGASNHDQIRSAAANAESLMALSGEAAGYGSFETPAGSAAAWAPEYDR